MRRFFLGIATAASRTLTDIRQLSAIIGTPGSDAHAPYALKLTTAREFKTVFPEEPVRGPTR